jgi:hypothetical protein
MPLQVIKQNLRFKETKGGFQSDTETKKRENTRKIKGT